MTYAITLVKCEISKRNEALELLTNLKKQKDPFGNKVRIKEFYISFGWPDFVLLLRGNNIELLKDSIVLIRRKYFDITKKNLETSTLICTTTTDIKKAKKDIKSALIRK